MLAKHLIDYLSNQGFNVFPQPNFIPAEIQESQLPALFVFGTGGYGPDEMLPVTNPTFQVIVKGKNFKNDPMQMTSTEEIAQQVITLFHQKDNYVIGETHVYASQAIQSNPIPIGLDDKDRPVYSTNFLFKVRG